MRILFTHSLAYIFHTLNHSMKHKKKTIEIILMKIPLFLKLHNRFLTESYATAWIAFEEIVSKTFSKTFYYNDVRRPM